MDERPGSLAGLADEAFCYLTTTGRVSGEPREIEIWFGVDGGTLYMLSGSGERDGRPAAHWVRNLLKQPAVSVRVGTTTLAGRARVVERGTPEDALARRLLVAKYQSPGGSELESWGRTSVTVAVDLAGLAP